MLCKELSDLAERMKSFVQFPSWQSLGFFHIDLHCLLFLKKRASFLIFLFFSPIIMGAVSFQVRPCNTKMEIQSV